MLDVVRLVDVLMIWNQKVDFDLVFMNERKAEDNY